MSGDNEKLTFGGIELSLADTHEQGQRANFMLAEEQLGVYTGPERRRVGRDRRVMKSRRGQLRFEPGRAADRRTSKDRRKNGGGFSLS